MHKIYFFIIYLKPIICFAGEGTHEIHFSTVHGAFLSGIREAERIANYFTSKENAL